MSQIVAVLEHFVKKVTKVRTVRVDNPTKIEKSLKEEF